MEETTGTSTAPTANLPEYANSWEHLTSELKRLSLLVGLQVLMMRHDRPGEPLDQLKGLVITETEVSNLLVELENANTSGAEANALDTDKERLTSSLARQTSEIQARREASWRKGIYLSLPHLSQLFGFSRFEEQCLVICLAPEIDRRYEKLYSYIQDDVTRKKPTVDLAMQLLCGDSADRIKARLAFDSNAPLLKHRMLILTGDNEPLLSRSLRLDDRIVDYLLALGRIDAGFEFGIRIIFPDQTGDALPFDENVRQKLSTFARSVIFSGQGGEEKMLFLLSGPNGSGRVSVARAVCSDLGVPLIVADLEKIIAGPIPFAEAALRLCREAVLQPAALCIENFHYVLANDNHTTYRKELLEAIARYSSLTFLVSRQSWRPHSELDDHIFIEQKFTVPAGNVRKRLWREALSNYTRVTSDCDLGSLASNFQFTVGQIRGAVAEARNLARWRTASSSEILLADLHKACRGQSTAGLTALAQRIEPRYCWEDIVLPIDQSAQLREICIQARHRDVVYGDWGFERKLSLGRGLNVLFSGPAGTGKTMAAEVIARELGLDLYKIDLSQVVSKYIGETERNLNQVFYEAKSCYAILFFDEADALFGKRSEVKDAHDRYSNIEIGYLLQKMEEYDGIAILATNLRQNMDESFCRRLQVIVDFPFPSEEYREQIWAVIFPFESPLGKDVDFRTLAREIKLSGGSIKNIALAAAFSAAADGGVIRMTHLVNAAKREYQKLGRVWSTVELSERIAV